MNCEACREALSARLDGEGDPALHQRVTVDAHLSSCQQCRQWFEDAADLTRLARTVLVGPPSPGVDAAVLDALPSRRRWRIAHALSWALGGLGVAQLVLGAAQITALAGQTHSHAGQLASAGHLWHESAAWNLAIGVGFAWIAARRTRPAAVLPMLSVFVAVLTLLSIGDLLAGRVQLSWLLSHGVMLAGYAIVLCLSRPAFDFGDPPSGRGAGRSPLRLDDALDDLADRRSVPPGSGDRPANKPATASRRRAVA